MYSNSLFFSSGLYLLAFFSKSTYPKAMKVVFPIIL